MKLKIKLQKYNCLDKYLSTDRHTTPQFCLFAGHYVFTSFSFKIPSLSLIKLHEHPFLLLQRIPHNFFLWHL